jgi:integrase
MSPKIPAYRLREDRNLAVVTLVDARTQRRHDYYLGSYNTPESRQRYFRLIAAWEAAGRCLPDQLDQSENDQAPQQLTISELLLQYLKHVTPLCVPSELHNLKLLTRLLNQFYGSTPAADFGPRKLRVIRDQMVEGDPTSNPPRRPYCRASINKHTHRIAAIFKWAASYEILPVAVYQQLKTIEPLRRGRTTAKESEPVRPVGDHLVDPLENFLSKQVWAIIQLQRFTGARCGELFKLRQIDLRCEEKTGIWTFSPGEHKTAHYGNTRTIYFGPKAQAVLRPFFDGRRVDAYLFSPIEAERERRAEMHAARTTPDGYGNEPGTNVKENPQRSPGEFYTTASYRRAIDRACRLAFPPPAELQRIKVKAMKGTRWESDDEWRKRLGPKQWQRLTEWVKAHHWHPHQLRHAAATAIRREFGLEAAQIALGHSSALVTEAVYAERDMQKAVTVMRAIG